MAKDHAAICRLRLALDQEGDDRPLEFREVENCNDALRLLDTWEPQLVVAEVGVAPYGAFGFVRDLKAAPDRSCPVILVLERAQDDWLGRWSGADALVHRPVNARALREAAGRLLAEASERPTPTG